jgi:hypothetical protein
MNQTSPVPADAPAVTTPGPALAKHGITRGPGSFLPIGVVALAPFAQQPRSSVSSRRCRADMSGRTPRIQGTSAHSSLPAAAGHAMQGRWSSAAAQQCWTNMSSTGVRVSGTLWRKRRSALTLSDLSIPFVRGPQTTLHAEPAADRTQGCSSRRPWLSVGGPRMSLLRLMTARCCPRPELLGPRTCGGDR